MTSVLLTLIVSTAIASEVDERPVQSVRVAFVPGDSIVPTMLPRSTVTSHSGFEDQDNDGRIRFTYDYPAVPLVGPVQFFGFERLDLSSVDERAIRILRRLEAFTSAEATAMLEAEDHSAEGYFNRRNSPCRYVIVNSYFDSAAHRLFLRYNENWMRPAEERSNGIPDYGFELADVSPRLYQPHLWDPQAVAADWEHAIDVDPLRVTYPKVISFTKKGPRRIAEPVTAEFGDVAVVGVPARSIQTIFSRNINSTFFVATRQGVARYRWVLSRELRNELSKEDVYKEPLTN